MSAAVGASVLAHGLHYAMVLAGLWGLAALLLPHALSRVLPAAASYDEHDARVARLRAAVAVGAPGIPAPAGPLAARPVDAPGAASPLSLPLAVVATGAAAGIHAAVAPPHLREQVLSGAFFLVVALAQLAWTLRATRRPTATLFRAGIALHLALIGLWVVTRTLGLPFGLLAAPHPVGPWDLACVAWQVVAVTACARLLRDGVPARFPGWFDWPPTSRAAVGAAAVSLVLLTLSGAHS